MYPGWELQPWRKQHERVCSQLMGNYRGIYSMKQQLGEIQKIFIGFLWKLNIKDNLAGRTNLRRLNRIIWHKSYTLHFVNSKDKKLGTTG